MSEYSMNRREFMRGVAGAAAVGGGAGNVSANHDYEASQLKQTIEHEAQRMVTIAEQENHHDHKTVYLGVDGTLDDLYGVSLANNDNAFVDENYGLFSRLASSVANKVRHSTIADDDEVVVYLGITGDNQSFLPGKLQFHAGEHVNADQKVNAYMDDLEVQKREARHEFTEYQWDAINQLGLDEYAQNERFVFSTKIDGMPHDGWDDLGQAELAGQEFEVKNTEDNDLQDPYVEIRTRSAHGSGWDHGEYTEGDQVDVGPVTLQIQDINHEHDYVVADRVEGTHYSHLDAPFPQI